MSAKPQVIVRGGRGGRVKYIDYTEIYIYIYFFVGIICLTCCTLSMMFAHSAGNVHNGPNLIYSLSIYNIYRQGSIEKENNYLWLKTPFLLQQFSIILLPTIYCELY